VRNLLFVAGIVTLALPLWSQAPAHAQARGQGAAAAPQGGGRGGVLGPVNALGQEVKRPPVPTGPPPRLPDGTVDLNGLWNGGGPVNSIAQGLKQGETLPLLPLAKQLMDLRSQPKNETDDPHLWCMPMGVPRSVPYPFRFVQNYTHKAPTHMFILHEGNIHSYRQIFMDGRPHPGPRELDPTWYGHSTGRWDGDTLVVDSVGFNDRFWFDFKGHPHTERLHIVERYTRTSRTTLQNEITIDDPGAYARPFTVRFTAEAPPAGDELQEYICNENNMDVSHLQGPTGPPGDPERSLGTLGRR
jgi:hypothetical protein